MSEKRIRELFEMSPARQIRHWAGDEPWENMKLPNTTEIRPNQVLRNANNDIIHMPVILKPCFGQPTAFVRHGGHRPIRSPRFGAVKSRCMRCLAQDACERTAKARLMHSDEIKRAYLRFQQAGGSFGLDNPFHCPTAEREFEGLVGALTAHGGFSSTNDRAAIEVLDNLEERRKDKHAERKRRQRRASISVGCFDSEFEELLERHRQWREVQLRLVTKTAERRRGLPPCINRMPVESARITSQVWLAMVEMKLRKAKTNPSSIAAQLIRRWPAEHGNHNSLRQRVAGDMKRVQSLERTVIHGADHPIWPAFSLASALAELGLAAPYTGKPPEGA